MVSGFKHWVDVDPRAAPAKNGRGTGSGIPGDSPVSSLGRGKSKTGENGVSEDN